MMRGSGGLDPRLLAFVKGRRIGRRALAAVHRRALARAEESVAASQVMPSPAGMRPTSPITGHSSRLWLALASAILIVAGGIAAVAGIHRWSASGPQNNAPSGPRIPPLQPSDGVTPLRRPPTQPTIISPPPPAAAAPPAPAAAAPSARLRHGGPGEEPGAAELDLLTRAHAAYERGDFTLALKLAAEHARRYPHGHLAEQREFLRVKSLLDSGQIREGHRAATAFADRFPRSILLSPLLDGPKAP